MSGYRKACGADNTVCPFDNAVPYLTLSLVGHVLGPLLFWLDRAWEPAIWLPLITSATVALLPFAKGAVIGFAWATGVTRQTARQ